MTYPPDYSEVSQYNGNIASLSWRAPLGTCRDIQGYHFSYDGVNRLRGATFWERSSGAPTITDKYSEPLLNYNLNGNITTYQRRGQTTSNTFDLIDNLVYFYDANTPDGLIRVLTYFPQTPSPPSPHSAHPSPLK